MCRLCLFNGPTVDYLERTLLEYHFDALEQLQGGDGMGVAALWPNGDTRLHKGLEMTPAEAAYHICKWRESGAEWFIFHTRLASCGNKSTRNCHPFKLKGTVMAHNGTALDFKPEDGCTDSENVLRIMKYGRLGLDFLNDVPGVFIGFQDGKPFVRKGGASSSLKLLRTGDAVLFTSDAPSLIADCFETVAVLGKHCFPQEVVTVTSSKHYRDWYDWNDWNDDYSYKGGLLQGSYTPKSQHALKRRKYRLTTDAKKLAQKHPVKKVYSYTAHTHKGTSSVANPDPDKRVLLSSQDRERFLRMVALDRQEWIDNKHSDYDLGCIEGLTHYQLDVFINRLKNYNDLLSDDQLCRYFWCGPYSQNRKDTQPLALPAPNNPKDELLEQIKAEVTSGSVDADSICMDGLSTEEVNALLTRVYYHTDRLTDDDLDRYFWCGQYAVERMETK